ncbi:MAG: hydantoinase/oxoprolinase family protein [Candidatus Tectomicrobia bacterium]|nr:hydantoinase/oxoprolinase family protein [Candidatus Tectomicrobia bacterium]
MSETAANGFRYRLGVDIGGTFTDVVLLDLPERKTYVGKVLTTPESPADAVIQGLRRILADHGVPPDAIDSPIHGTTLVTNAIIERKGAKTALLTTKGFRDSVEIGTEKRYDLFDIFLEKPEPLAPRHLRLEVAERLDPEGNVLIPLDEEGARRVIERLDEMSVRAVAVTLLHSFMNPAHERRLEALIRERSPRILTSLSSEVTPEIREYPRSSTTLANAYVRPLMRAYLDLLGRRIREEGVRKDLYIMLSNGGVATVETAEAFPIRLIESGPAAGAMAAAYYGKQLNLRRLISFDMGGTTAKTCFVEDGRPSTVTEFEVARVYQFKKGSGLPVKVPVIDMIEIGAGGGSIAHRDALGLLKVGPESSGADPGPACYGRGGDRPTVTDADLLLGYLDPKFFLGGAMDLDLGAADSAVGRLAKALGLERLQTAWGIHEVVNENMANAARIHGIEKGKDVQQYALMAFGGAGPIHAAHVAEKLRIGTILCPPGAGTLSALGMLTAPISFDFVRTKIMRLDALDPQALNALYQEMEAEGRALLERSGVPAGEMTFRRSADMRYEGQGYEIQVPLPAGRLSAGSVEEIRAGFERSYKAIYQRLGPNVPVEALNWRLVASGGTPRLDLRPADGAAAGPEGAKKPPRPVYFPIWEERRECDIYDRDRLGPGARIPGPAVVEEKESTVVVPPGWDARTDEFSNLVLQRRR